jgi:hypothetical protein
VVKPLVASLQVVAVLPDAKRVELTATIRPPYEIEHGQWAARVQVKPLQEKALEVRGVDSFHALWLACSLVLKVLAQLAAEGAQLRNADGTEFPLQAYLAGLDGKR